MTNIINHFWHHSRAEYVTNLREYHKLRSLNSNSLYIKVNGELIYDDIARRHLKASIKVPRTGRTVQQPTSKLIPIECIESYLQNNDPDKGVLQRLYIVLVEMQPSFVS